MIRSLEVQRAAILDCSNDHWKTAVGATSDEIVMGEVQAVCEFSVLASKQNHSHLSLTALNDSLKRFYKKKGAL
jgi:hypothetical protein